MMHNVYLQGELGEKFGHKFVVEAETYQDVVRCINANRPEFKQYLVDCHHGDIGFIFDTAGKGIEEDTELLEKLKEGDITIAVAPMGSKSGFAKILIAIAILFVLFNPAVGAALGTTATASGASVSLFTAAGVAGTAGLSTLASIAVYAGASIGMSLLSAGLQQMLAPDPSVDNQSASSNYLFDGSAGASREGDPAPILYGELRVPGRPIAVNVVPGRYRMSSTNITFNGDLDAIDTNPETDDTTTTTDTISPGTTTDDGNDSGNQQRYV